jgi:7-keto-8-aminopelargonate synthetase-like enzyme
MNDQSNKKLKQIWDFQFGYFSSDYNNYLDGGQKEIVNFGLNDYLSISADKRIRQLAGDKSPTCISEPSHPPPGLRFKTEELLSSIFEKQVILLTDHFQVYSTIFKSFSHNTDAFIIDQNAQSKIQIATDVLRKEGKLVSCLPHNKLDILEEQLIQLKNKHQHVWYLASSIYSTTGSITTIDKLQRLLQQYDHLRVLIDDTHGLSWTGKNGQGFVFKSLGHFPNVIITASLCKGFGAEGRIIICNNNKLKTIITRDITPFRNFNPIDTCTLNIIEISAGIHLSPEIYVRQVELKDRIEYFNAKAQKLQIPLAGTMQTPIGFVYAGKPDLCQELSCIMQNRGYYLPPVTFPTLPVNSSGLRIAISLYHTKDTIKRMLLLLKDEYERSLKKRGLKMEDLLSPCEL